MIEQRVKLSKLAHKTIGEAQRDLGLARFEDALGYFVEGSIASLKPASILDRMKLGMNRKLRGR